jgi:hypothetical protein
MKLLGCIGVYFTPWNEFLLFLNYNLGLGYNAPEYQSIQTKPKSIPILHVLPNFTPQALEI